MPMRANDRPQRSGAGIATEARGPAPEAGWPFAGFKLLGIGRM